MYIFNIQPKFLYLSNTEYYDIINVQREYFFLVFQAKLETKALKAKRPGFTDERYNETSYYIENGKDTK